MRPPKVKTNDLKSKDADPVRTLKLRRSSFSVRGNCNVWHELELGKYDDIDYVLDGSHSSAWSCLLLSAISSSVV